ncbi:MAG: 4'-phosphopantetheinyl transferase superfamily protein [Neisseria sp.]|nr:4'-phosphopantetheinyl transferase superfamily protein [Neisseria sp.]
MPSAIHILLADASVCPHYRPELLDESDRQRLQQHLHLAQKSDWQSSRFLKQHAVAPVRSLSHSHGHAALVASTSPQAFGIDIERIKTRDFPSLASWVCSDFEREYLAQNHWQATEFYRLWCIKEALIKACQLDFPADLNQVGYTQTAGGIALRSPHSKPFYGISTQIHHDFILACVWQNPNTQINWQTWGKLKLQNLRHY